MSVNFGIDSKGQCGYGAQRCRYYTRAYADDTATHYCVPEHRSLVTPFADAGV